ncbi:MAG: glycoside hydrolase family 13 protein [Bacillota bacterium]|nr:glycoside hydrolase family 13 protein [Bacillota bacterium]
MIKEAVYHEIDSDYAYALSKRELLVKLRTKKDDVKKVNLVYLDKYKYGRTKESFWLEMKKVASDLLFDYYEAIVEVNMISVWYYFQLIDENETLYYGNYKFTTRQPEDGPDVFIMPTMAEKDIFVTPDWASEAIVYQIFPERFCNGDPSLNPEGIQEWYSKINHRSMLGGDLPGIISKLDYLEDLGINTIYLTPIFESGSNHKYNTYDYFKIDPQFGTMDTLKELVQKAHSRGMKVVLDAVFNHCGTDFPAFKDVLEKGEESQYKHWFDIRKFPVEVKENPNYSTFAYHGGMPKLMTKNKEVKDYLISIATYWIKEADIDGWRLDVADEIDHDFWRDFREAVKEVKEDAIIVGEVWYDSTSWLKGDQFDSVMNYDFNNAVGEFVAGESISPKVLGERLGFLRGLYKIPAYKALWNLIDSHDTSRFLHKAGENPDKLKLAAFLQLTTPGAPFIYYGDEVGMTGGADPDCRRGMLWDEERQNKEVFEHYKKLISIRKQNKALYDGDFKTIYTDDNVYGFRREYDMDIIDAYVNNANEEVVIKIEANTNLVDLLSGQLFESNGEKVQVRLVPKQGVIFKMA